jgi:hypothetical protein
MTSGFQCAGCGEWNENGCVPLYCCKELLRHAEGNGKQSGDALGSQLWLR